MQTPCNQKSGQAFRGRSGQAHRRRSGQAIIFLMVVVVIGLFVVIWNFDLHRIITAKVRVRNAADAAAMAGARWQGVTLNMIGDLNLIQAAILSEEAANQLGADEFVVPDEVIDLHDLRNRLTFFGPLAAFAIAQQVAFDNGAFNDEALAANLMWLAEEIREQQNAPPYDNLSFDDYADLLENIVAHGVAVSSYTPTFPDHPLTQEKFYTGIAYALGGLWCGLEDYEYELKNYNDYTDWSNLDLDIILYYMLELKLQEFVSRTEGSESLGRNWPGIALTTNTVELEDYFDEDNRGAFSGIGGDPEMVLDLFEGMYPWRPTEDIRWHTFAASWRQRWPLPRDGEDDLEDDEDQDYFPIWGDIQDRYNYMGAETGIGISMPVHRGILASSERETVDLEYKAKAKPFGYVEADTQDFPPYYYGFVLPVFTDVRLIHTDIGDHQVPSLFFRHVAAHLGAYLDSGPDALNPACRYCQLLQAWEKLDKNEGLRWLEEAEDSEDNPCDPNDDGSEFEGLIGGATRGS